MTEPEAVTLNISEGSLDAILSGMKFFVTLRMTLEHSEIIESIVNHRKC